jgi:hypothetical protein
MHDGRVIDVPEPPREPFELVIADVDVPPPAGPTVAAPLGALMGARSGDKGGDANVGIWARSDDAYVWLRSYLDVPRLKQLLPEAADLEVSRYELANIRGINFVIHGLLGEGVASSTRPDPQAKSLGEALRAIEVDVPVDLIR